MSKCQFYAAMAQSVERILGKDEVSSSILLSSTEFARYNIEIYPYFLPLVGVIFFLKYVII